MKCLKCKGKLGKILKDNTMGNAEYRKCLNCDCVFYINDKNT